MHHKQTSPAEVAVWGMKIVVTIGEVNQVAAALVELKEATAILVLVEDQAVVVALEIQTNIKMVEMEQETKADPMATWVMPIALFFRMMEPHYNKFKGNIHLKHLRKAGELAHNNGTLPWLNHHWRNIKSMICCHNILG